MRSLMVPTTAVCEQDRINRTRTECDAVHHHLFAFKNVQKTALISSGAKIN